jgi:hypothetical protein
MRFSGAAFPGLADCRAVKDFSQDLRACAPAVHHGPGVDQDDLVNSATLGPDQNSCTPFRAATSFLTRAEPGFCRCSATSAPGSR